MAGLTTEVQRLIERDQLGLPLEIYGPPTTLTLTGGIAALIVAVSLVGFCIYVLILNFAHTSFSWSIFELNSNKEFFFELSIFLLLSVPCFIVGLQSIFKAISNRDRCVVFCAHGVAVLWGRNFESFRWQEVLTIFTPPRYKRRLIFTVHCHDGRKFVFQDLSDIEQLAEHIDVYVARAKQS